MVRRFRKLHEEDPDALADEARDALRAGDSAGAVQLLRAACKVSPFRDDLRDALSAALEADLRTDFSGDDEDEEWEEEEEVKKPSVSRASRTTRKNISRRIPSVEPKIWFGVVTAFLCAGAVAFVLTQVNVIDLLRRSTADPIEQNIDELYQNSIVYMGQQRYPEAVSALEQALALQPADPRFLLDLMADIYAKQGDQLTNDKRYADAVDIYLKAVDYRDDSADLFHELGFAQYKAARQLQEDASLVRDSKTRATIKQYDESAIRSFEHALDLDAGHLFARHTLALALIKTGSVARATTELAEILKRDGVDSEMGRSAIRILRSQGADVDRVLKQINASGS